MKKLIEKTIKKYSDTGEIKNVCFLDSPKLLNELETTFNTNISDADFEKVKSNKGLKRLLTKIKK